MGARWYCVVWVGEGEVGFYWVGIGGYWVREYGREIGGEGEPLVAGGKRRGRRLVRG
jgi:hypothetical protein